MKLKYIGNEPTIVELERGGKRADIEKNDVFKTDELVGKDLLSAYAGMFEETDAKITVTKAREEEIEKYRKAKAKEEAKAVKENAERLAEEATEAKKQAEALDKQNGGGSTANDDQVERISPSTVQKIGK